MATTKVIDLIDRAEELLQDTTNVRWSQAELLNYFNDAQKHIVMQRPDANMVNYTHTCSATAKQSLPTNSIKLMNVIRNASGNAVSLVDRYALDQIEPTWYTGSANTAVKHWMYDSLDPTVFYVYPVPTASVQLELVYSAQPNDIAMGNFSSDTTVISLNDSYRNPILDYMLYRAYSKDTEGGGSAQKSTSYFQSCQASLQIKVQIDSQTNPIADTPDTV